LLFSYKGRCLFAHSKEELIPLPKPPNYKTKLCNNFHKSTELICYYGANCRYIHHQKNEVNLLFEKNLDLNIKLTTNLQQFDSSADVYEQELINDIFLKF